MPDKPDFLEPIFGALEELCNIPSAELDERAELRELGVDSFMLLSIVSHVEAAHQIHLGEDDMQHVFGAESIGDLASVFVAAWDQRARMLSKG